MPQLIFTWIGKHLADLSFVFIGAWMYSIILTRLTKAVIPWKELIIDQKSGTLDYKMMMMVVCATLQSITWLRLSFGYNVSSALDSPSLWITFYSVIAGHDILGRVVDAWATKNKRPDGGQGDASDNSTPNQ